MPLDATQYKAGIPVWIGDVSNAVASQIEVLWTKHDDKELHLRALHVELDGIDILLGRVWGDINETAASGARLELEGKRRNLEALRKSTVEKIAAYKATRSGRHTPAVGMMTATSPAEPPVGYLNPNSAQYRGEPFPQDLIITSDTST